jgi:hypothetical protein
MDKIVEYVDAVMKSQAELMNSFANTQRQFMENWTQAANILQGSLLNMEKPQENAAKEMLTLYKSAFTAMVDSSKILADEAGKLQTTWKDAVEKQMNMNRELIKSFSGIFQKAA